MNDIVFVTSACLRLGNVSTRGRTHRALVQVLSRYSDDLNEIQIDEDSNWVMFNGTIPADLVDQMADELHKALVELKADPVMLIAGELFYCGIGQRMESFATETPDVAERIPAAVLQHVQDVAEIQEAQQVRPNPGNSRLGRLASPD